MVSGRKNHKRGESILSQKKVKKSNEKFDSDLIKTIDKDYLGIIVVLVILSFGFLISFNPSTIKTEQKVSGDELKLAVSSDNLSNCEGLSRVKNVICRQTINGELINSKAMINNEPRRVVRYLDEETNTLKPVYEKTQTIISEAFKTKDSKLCEQIKNSVKKDLCYFELLKVN